ncbi:MAG TPA: baseplate J/gp47 family protein [Candidatus Dormibacteraeota bacterium]
MATNPIYVETEEEIPELVERLRRYRGDDTMLVLPMRSRIGQSRFNFQLLRNYAARMGKRVTVVCDDPAVQKMASESGFPVFGAVGPLGEGIASEPEAEPPPRKWWQRRIVAPVTHVGVAPPTKLLTKSATEVKPGRVLLYLVAAVLLLVGLVGAAIFVPSASVTLVAQATPFSERDVEIQAQPGKPSTPTNTPIRVRVSVVSRSDSQGFKTTGVRQVQLAPAIGQVVYTNGCTHNSPTFYFKTGQRLYDPSNQLAFAQTSSTVAVDAGKSVTVNIQAVVPGTSGNVGSHVITQIVPNAYSCLTVDNPQATGGGADASSTPQMTETDFDAARAQLEAQLHQAIAQELAAGVQTGEKLSENIVYNAPQFNTDHQPNDTAPSFSGTMTVVGEGDYYFDADVTKAFQTYLTQRIPNDQQLLTESGIQTTYRLLSASKGGNLTFVGSATAYIAAKLDEAKVRAQIVGRPVTSAKIYLQTLGVKSVIIKELPMTLPLMPVLSKRIAIHYVVEQGVAPPSTATPSPSPTPKPSP